MDPSSAEFLVNYDQELRTMTRPDKAIINNLTMLAADHLENYQICTGIIRTVERCVVDAPPSRKLIPLYVMDSIIKNVGKIFTRLFLQNLVDIFCGAFESVDNQTRASFIKLLDTWEQQGVFAPDRLALLRTRLAQILKAGAAPPPMQMQAQAQGHMGMMSNNGGGGPPPQLVNAIVSQLDDRNSFLSIQQQQANLAFKVDALLQMQQGGGGGGGGGGGMHHGGGMLQPQAPMNQFQPPQQHNMMAAGPQGQFVPHPQHQHQHQHQQGFGPPAMMPPPARPPNGGGAGVQGNALQDLLQTLQQATATAGAGAGDLRTRTPPIGEPPATQPPRTLAIAELQSRDVSDVIRRLYDDQPYMCNSDGRRFRTAEERDAHLDTVFQQNRARKEGSGTKERHWLRLVEEWTGPARPAGRAGRASPLEVAVGQGAGAAGAGEEECFVAAEDVESGARCAACREELRAEWDAEEERWLYRGVMRVQRAGGGGEVLVHRTCFQPGGAYSEPTSPMATADTPRSETDPAWSAVKLQP